MIHPALVNPFLPPLTAAGNAAPANPDLAPKAGAAADPCCVDCGIREPCDAYCPHISQLVRNLRELTQAFEIEPVPTFLTRAHNA